MLSVQWIAASRELNCRRSILIDRLFLIPGFNYEENLAKRYSELRAQGIFDMANIEEMIAGNEESFMPYLEENRRIWPDSSKWYHDQNSYDLEIEIVLEYLRLRMTQLDERFQFPSHSPHP